MEEMFRKSGLARAAAAAAALEGASRFWNRVRERQKALQYQVTVSEDDSIYRDVHAWLLEVLPNERHRSLTIVTERRSDGGVLMDDSGPDESAGQLRVMFNDKRPRKLDVGTHRVTVQVVSPEATPDLSRRSEPLKIMFTSNTWAGQQAVMRKLAEINDTRLRARRPMLRMVDRWGSWRTRDDLPARTLDSVALPADQKRRIIDDMTRFLAEEEAYNKLAIPYHRGYMLHGPPGTGKTSLVKALAHHFALDLWYIGLADISAESNLMQLLSNVNPRSVVLLEDIDTVRFARDDEEQAAQTGKISRGSLLNALDGVATPHGLITFITTNHFDRVDGPLIRTGRMDVIEELGMPTPAVASELFQHFYKREIPVDLGLMVQDGRLPISPAEIAEVFKGNFRDSDAAAKALVDRIDERLPGVMLE